MTQRKIVQRCSEYAKYVKQFKDRALYPYFRSIRETSGTEVAVDGKKLIMISSNDYLGLTHDPRVIEHSTSMTRRYGTGTGGSRFLCGNISLHRQLEEELAAFVGKRQALVYSTGFSTNLGAIACLLRKNDIILFDRENHASIFDACRLTGARIVPFNHNDARDAETRMLKEKEKNPDGVVFLVTEGVFSMSGSVTDLPAFVELKNKYPEVYIYLDDAHGLGTMGEQGRGVCHMYDKTEDVDFIMGTFSKSFGSVGGFIACDDPVIAEHLQHKSRTMIFSAGLPAGNVATVLACLEIIRTEPERISRLWKNIERVKDGYKQLGIPFGPSESPILPVHIGDDQTSLEVSIDLFDKNIFALPVLYPAVPPGKGIIRTSFMSTHTEEQLDYFMETLATVLRKHDLLTHQ